MQRQLTGVHLSYIEVIILAFVEGLTEFLPISSTGHLVIVSSLMGINEEGFVKNFNVIIQVGAIVSVLVAYSSRFRWNFEFYRKLLLAFLPAAIIGLALKNKIDAVLGSLAVVAWTTFIGGFVLLWADRYFAKQDSQGKTIDQMTWQECLKLGVIQCLAFLPGVSRSGATIIGGLTLGLTRKEAALFSFFLAVPTLAGASAVKSLGLVSKVQSHEWGLIALGLVLSFVFALIAIRFFIGLISRYGFKHFGYYRILLGAFLLYFHYRG